MRRLAVLLLLAVALALVPTAPASATTVTVHDGAEYRQAITDLSADATGPHRIEVAVDVDLGDDDVPVYSSDQPLTLDGNGHTITGSAPWLLRNGLGSVTTLTIVDLTVDGLAAGVYPWLGKVVVRHSTFSGIGRGHPFADTGHAIYVVRDDPTTAGELVLDDVDILGTRSRWQTIQASVIRGSDVRLLRNDALYATVVGENVRLERSVVGRNLARTDATILGRSLVLIDTVVQHNADLAATPAPTIEGRRTVQLIRTTVRGNTALGAGRDQVAVLADDLVARGATVRHPARDCWVDGSVTATNSTASDPSCGF